MTADQYLWNILARETVDSSYTSPVRVAGNALVPIIREWASGYLNNVQFSGSFAKGTANRSGTDIDLFISLSNTTPNTLEGIYNTLFTFLQARGYMPKKQDVSINVKINGYSVDLVPAKQQDAASQDHSLYRNRANTWLKTNVQTHIQKVISGGRIQESRILKLWRSQHGLEFASFYVELTVIAALSGRNLGLSGNVWEAFKYLRDSFPTARVVDPANTNNVISDNLTISEKAKIRTAAISTLAASNWSQIVV